jgi:hypothetical protein
MTKRIIRFPDGDIKVGMMLSLRNKFARSLFHFLVIRSNHDKGLVRINLPFKLISIGFELKRMRLVFLLLQWQKEQRRHMNEVGHHFFGICLLRVCTIKVINKIIKVIQ